MSLAIKKDTDIEQLRAFGFALGEELAERPDFANYFIGREYQLSWWHKFDADPDSDTGAPISMRMATPRLMLGLIPATERTCCGSMSCPAAPITQG